MKKISIIMPYYKSLPRLKLVLASYINQTLDKNLWEIVLIDDGSEDNCLKFIDKYSDKFNLRYFYQKNMGRSVARNRGVEASEGSILLFADADMIASPDFIKAHYLKHIEERIEEPVVHGVVKNINYVKFLADPSTGKFIDNFDVNRNRKYSFLKDVITEEAIINDFGKIEKYKKMKAFECIACELLENPGKYSFPPWVASSTQNTSVRKELFTQAGGFDENMGKPIGPEDLEFGIRLYNSGGKFIFEPGAVNYHLDHFSPNMDKYMSQYMLDKYPTREVKLIARFVNGEIDYEGFLKEIAISDKPG